MYNPELLYYNSKDFSIQDNEALDELFDGQEFSELEVASLLDDDEAEEIFDGEIIDETEDFFVEASLYDELLDDDDTDDRKLAQLTEEINRETSSMSEYEAEYYVEERMAEFWPALAAALPAIIDLAPKALKAVQSIVQKGPSKKAAPAQTAAIKKPAVALTPSSNVDINSAGSLQVLRILTELIQSPKFLELLSGMLAGKTQTITASTGQQISGSNIMGVISSLAGALATGAVKREDKESYFPEYSMNNEGAFLIDPHNALQEAELILELIN